MFTQSGATARKFEKVVEAGQIGVNAPIPVPLPMFAWSGNKGSVLGGASLYGQRGLDFWTQLKVSLVSPLDWLSILIFSFVRRLLPLSGVPRML